jgi:arsenite methyltransferase
MSKQLLESVKSKYGVVAESTLSNDRAGVQAVAEVFGHTAEELTSNSRRGGRRSPRRWRV